MYPHLLPKKVKRKRLQDWRLHYGFFKTLFVKRFFFFCFFYKTKGWYYASFLGIPFTECLKMSLNATFVNLLQKKHGVVNIKDYYLSKKKKTLRIFIPLVLLDVCISCKQKCWPICWNRLLGAWYWILKS